MAWISKIIFFFLFLILLGWIRFLLASFLKPSSRSSFRPHNHSSSEPQRTISGRMVKDPQCGMYVATDLTVTAQVKGDTFHFCSPECRDSFISRQKTGQVSGLVP